MSTRLLAASVLVLATACRDSSEPPLSALERETVAQAYADSVRAIASPLDSACEARQADLVAYFADSIYEVRLADIERQRVVESPEQ